MLNKSCRWLDSNPGPLVSEATILPTALQPLHLVELPQIRVPVTENDKRKHL